MGKIKGFLFAVRHREILMTDLGLTYCFFSIFLPQKQHIMPDTLTFTSVVTIPGAHASAAFTSKTSEVFKEENDIAPIFISERMKYIPWGGDNQMPYKISALTILQHINFINNKPIGRIKYALN